jgi:hypothetical protein
MIYKSNLCHSKTECFSFKYFTHINFRGFYKIIYIGKTNQHVQEGTETDTETVKQSASI